MQPAQLLAYGDGLLSGLEAGQIRRPLGALLGLNQEIHQLFACRYMYLFERPTMPFGPQKLDIDGEKYAQHNKM